MLRQSDIAHYLLWLGLVKPRDVVEEDLTIIDASRRNSVFIATTSVGPTYVIKQGTPRTAPTLAHEAAMLRWLAGRPEVAGHVPTVLREEPESARLVLSTSTGGQDWSDYHDGRFPRTSARSLGRLLATLHRLPIDGLEELPPGVDRMWALSLSEPPYEFLLELSAGAQDVVGRLQQDQVLCDRLETLRDTGPDGTLVHGDLRWENCLAASSPGSRRKTRVLLVDWELAGRGAAGFDVGTVLAEYLRVWVDSIPRVEQAEPGRLATRARHPLRRIQPAMQAFWSAYRLASPDPPTLRSVVDLAAVRILQTAVEQAQGLVRASAHVMTLVQLASNMLRDPHDSALNLLSLRA